MSTEIDAQKFRTWAEQLMSERVSLLEILNDKSWNRENPVACWDVMERISEIDTMLSPRFAKLSLWFVQQIRQRNMKSMGDISS